MLHMWTHHDHRPLRVVVAGGGVAALELAVALRALAPERADVRIVAPSTQFSWRALEVGEQFGLAGSRSYPLDELAPELGAEFVHDAVHRVSRETREVMLQSGGRLEYDVLVVAVGAFPFPADPNSITYGRHLDHDTFDEVVSDLQSGLADRLLVVVPAGVTWALPAYELALLSAHTSTAQITLATVEPQPLSIFGTRASAEVGRALDDAGVEAHYGVTADIASAGTAWIGGHWLVADRIVSLPSLSGPRLRGLPSDRNGFIITDDAHRVPDCDGRVFAVGDGVAGAVHQGGLAAQAAGQVAARIAEITGTEHRSAPALPMLRGVLRTATGPLFLEAALDDPEGTSVASRKALWWPPSKVAAPWLSAFIADLETRRLATSATDAR